MSTIKSSAENLTLNADGANNDIKFQSNGVEKASIDQDGKITAGGASLDGAVVINESGADVDFRVESDTNTNALIVNGQYGVGIGIAASSSGEPLVVGGSSTTAYATTLTHATGDDCAMAIRNSSDTANNFSGINFLDAGGFANSGIFNVNEDHDSGGGGYLALLTREDSTTADTMTQRLRIDGDGLKFNADTAAANALDDYEEGTWTAAFTVSSGSVVTNSSKDLGRYTKIGRTVHIQGNFVTQSHSSPSGTLSITGLPFTTPNDTDLSEEVFFYIGANNITNNAGKPLIGYVGASSTTITIYTSDGNNLAGAGTTVNNNGYMGLSFTYTI